MTKTIEATWLLLQQHQGETFHTAKGLPFTYTTVSYTHLTLPTNSRV